MSVGQVWAREGKRGARPKSELRLERGGGTKPGQSPCLVIYIYRTGCPVITDQTSPGCCLSQNKQKIYNKA